jgi:peptidyl-prolyl cis-trans isomerase B (cyclophilin B)
LPRWISGAAVALALLVSACGGSGGDEGAAIGGSTPQPDGTTTAPNGVCVPATSAIGAIQRQAHRDDQPIQFTAPPARVINPAKKYVAKMYTNRGLISIDLAAADVPNTVNNFVYLSCAGFYDGLTFHRVVKSPTPFVIQGGDPKGTGQGGPGYIFNNEISPNIRHDTGVLSMANSGANTNGSQFFITLAPAPTLDGQYSAFGRVTAGMDVANAIRQGDVILSISIEES